MTPDHGLLTEWYVRGAVAQEQEPNGYPAVWDIEYDEYTVRPEKYGSGRKNQVLPLQDAGLEDVPADEELWTDDDPDEFLDAIAEIAGLTGRERRVVQWIAEGNQVTGIDYADRMASALSITPAAARKCKARTISKLREHWAADMVDAEGLVDPRYLEPKRDDEFVCSECNMIRHENLRGLFGCTECES